MTSTQRRSPAPRRAGGTNDSPGANALEQSGLPGLAGYVVRRADVYMHQEFARTLARRNIRPAEYGILTLVGSNPLLTQAYIAGALSMQRPNLVGLIGRLERRGLLRRSIDERDRRNHRLSLTAKGKSLLGEVSRLVLQQDVRATRCWTRRERSQVLDLLQRLYGPKGRPKTAK